MHKFTLLLMVLTFSLPLSAFDISEDASGSSDYGGLVRYPSSKIDSYSVRQGVEYRLALGQLKNVNGILNPEYSSRLAGDLTRITYRIPDGHQSVSVFEHFKSVIPQPYTLLYECHGRECGSSNHWANHIFRVAKLYGPERYQHYLAARTIIAGQDVVVALYSIKRGNKRLYAHLDLLEVESEAARGLNVTASSLLNSLREEGRFVLPELGVDQQGTMAPEVSEFLTVVASVLKRDVRIKLYVVGHAGPMKAAVTLDDLKARSLSRAQTVVDSLVQLGVDATRLTAHGVGPLAPSANAYDGADRIELVLRR